jgi:23S rRNA (cytosine1962-C5)-methyltransferase
MSLPKLRIKYRNEIRIICGSPWIFSNEIENFSELKKLEKGSLVEVVIKKDQPFAISYFNPHSLIAARILSNKIDEKIDENFFIEKILAAKNLREKFFDKPFYRLIHSEGDFLPGLVIDRFDDVFVCQISTAGMEKMIDFLISALSKIFSDAKIIFRNDIESRKYENLESYVKIVKGEIADKIQIEENEVKFLVDVKQGQKTGWFFDQRKNREFIASIAKDCDILDAYCYLGAFGLNALKNQAKSITFLDSSQEAIDQVQKNISLNNFSQNYQLICGKVFETLEELQSQNKRFDVVLLDPPAFIKNKKDIFAGLKGYEKLVKLAANLVKKDGIMMLSSCSHHAELSDLISAANDGFRKLNRKARLIRSFGANIDHPINTSLKEGEYLKSATFLLD